jgi:predicted phage terminase large subunit-like protein
MTAKDPKAALALEKRRRREETIESVWRRVHDYVPDHMLPAVRCVDQYFAAPPSQTTKRVIVSAWPGAGKSTFGELVAARAVTRGLSVLLFSYSTKLARAKSTKAQKLARDFLGAKISRTQSAPSEWALADGSASMVANGLSGTGTGFRGPIVIIDDHTLGRATAESAAHREATNDAVRAVARTRVDPGGLVLIISTRWHPQDASANAIEAGYESFLSPAITPSGASAWPDRFALDELRTIEAEIGDRDFQALYQAAPQSNASLLFNGATLIEKKDLDVLGVAGAGFDGAYSARSTADASVALILAHLRDGRVCVVDVMRWQATIEVLGPELAAFAAKHGNPTFRWRTGGQEQAVATLLHRDGVNLAVEAARIDKISNAQRTASAWNRGKVVVLAGQPWTDRFVGEVCAFGPGAKRDDQVDALCNAYDTVPSEGSFKPLPPIRIVRPYDAPVAYPSNFQRVKRKWEM